MAANQNKPQTNPALQGHAVADPELIRQILEVEGKKIARDLQRFELDKKSIDSQGRLAELQIHAQAEYLKNRPHQNRKTLVTIGAIILTFLLVALGFITILFYMHKDAFANNILNALKYIIVGGGSYYAGTKRRKGDSLTADDAQDAEVVN